MRINRILGSIFLASFTAIGGGILTLPTNTFQSGFIPSCVSLGVTWMFMLLSSFYLLAVNVQCSKKKEADLLSMSEYTLGKKGKYLMFVAYLALLYALLCAYIKGTTAWILVFLNSKFGVQVPEFVGYCITSIMLGGVVFCSTRATDYLNRVFVLVAIAAYGLLLVYGIPEVNYSNLEHVAWHKIFPAMPLLLTTMGYAIIVPTISSYLNYEVKALKIVLFIGSAVPLIVYLLWEFVALGSIPVAGDMGLAEIAARQGNSTEVALALENAVGHTGLHKTAKIFSLFAIMTSLLGVGLSLYHFLTDGISIQRGKQRKLLLFIATFMPPILILEFYPSGFDHILSFGGIFVSVVLGIIPACMMWSLRYVSKTESCINALWSSKPILCSSLLFFSYIILQELSMVLAN